VISGRICSWCEGRHACTNTALGTGFTAEWILFVDFFIGHYHYVSLMGDQAMEKCGRRRTIMNPALLIMNQCFELMSVCVLDNHCLYY